MPFVKSRYHANWKEISKRIRERSQGRCECMGECGARHRGAGRHRLPVRCTAENGLPHPETGSKVVLTVAHLDNDTANNADSNLKAMCQRCHLTYDARFHAKNAAQTRRNKKIQAGQGELLL